MRVLTTKMSLNVIITLAKTKNINYNTNFYGDLLRVLDLAPML